MDVLKEKKYFRYVEKAPIWLSISALVIVIGLVVMGINFARTKAETGDGHFFNLSIHYTGGDQLILRFAEPVEEDGQNILRIVKKFADGEPIVQVAQPKEPLLAEPAEAAEHAWPLIQDEPPVEDEPVEDPVETADETDEPVADEAAGETEPGTATETGDEVDESATEPVDEEAAEQAFGSIEEAIAGLDLEPGEPAEAEIAAAEPPVATYNDGLPHEVSIRLRVKLKGTLDPEGVVDGEGDLDHEQVLIALKQALGNAYGGYQPGVNPETIESTFVGPIIGGELIRNTILALVFGCVLIMFYILFRFGRWQMSLAAIGALVHDVLITLGFTALLGLEVSDSFIAVILTIIGYSINDTIIIFDRVRENLRNYGEKDSLAQICNISLNQTLVRSLNTVITVIFMIVALMIFGGGNIRDFLTAMLIGMISGGYSSIFVATPLMLWFSRGKLKMEEEESLVAPGVGKVDFSVPAGDEEVKLPLESEDPTAAPVSAKAKAKKTKKQRRR